MRYIRVLACRALIATALLAAVSCASSYDKEVSKSLKRIYGADFKAYKVRGTPVGTFGAGTMYLDEIENGKLLDVDASWLIGHPDTWWAPGVTDAEKTALREAIIVKGTLPTVDLKEEITRKLGVKATLPKLYEVVAADVGADFEKGVKVALTAAQSTNHRINWTEFVKAINDGKIKTEIKNHVLARDFRIVAADIEYVGYRATVEIDKSLETSVGAKFAQLAAAGMLQGTDLKITAAAGQQGKYVVESTKPVVVALLIKRPPEAQLLSAETDILTWPDAKVDPEVLRKVEAVATGPGVQ